MPDASGRVASTQEIFQNCYRGRSGFLRHLAYLRTGKVFLLLRLLEACRTPLGGRRLFDYGFGAGTFFLHCPRDCRIAGIELDARHVANMAEFLRAQGFADVELGSADVDGWDSNPLLRRKYDVIVCSHVLEHVDRPADLVRSLGASLASGGTLACLVPINEREANPHHLREISADDLRAWGTGAGLDVRLIEQADPWAYWLQPLFCHDRGWRHRLAQTFSLSFGLFLAAAPRALHPVLERAFATATRSRPTQMGVVYAKPA